jgi:hypothetical protein
LLELAEFPWRMLGPAGLCAAVLAGALLYYGELMTAGTRLSGVAGRAALALTLLLTLASTLYYLFPTQFISWGTPTPTDVMAYEEQSRAIGTTSTGEFLPRWADRYPSPDVLSAPQSARLDPATLPQGAVSTTMSHTARETLMSVDSPVPFTATFRALYWPGWQVWISRQLPAADAGQMGGWQLVPQPEITQPDGLIRVPLPAGRYVVMLLLGDTPLRTAGALISLACLLGCLALAAITRRSRSRLEETSLTTGRKYPRREAVVVGIAVIAGLLGTRPLGDWLRVQSPPGTVQGVQHPLRAAFGDEVCLLGYDLPICGQWIGGARCASSPAGALPEMQARAGTPLTAVLYWQALRPLELNYSVFLHLDAPDGKIYAGTDEVNPEDIPTSAWPPALYLRNPLTVAVPADAPAIRYALTAGLYDRETGRRLSVTECGGCSALPPGAGSLPLAYVWLLPAHPLDESDIPQRLDYRVGEGITLLGYRLESGETARLTLYWRAEERLATGYTVFVHAQDDHGGIVGQSDSPPVSGLYPTDAWLPGQVIADVHTLALPPRTQTLAAGLYDPGSMARLPVRDAHGQPVPDDAIIIQVSHGTQ